MKRFGNLTDGSEHLPANPWHFFDPRLSAFIRSKLFHAVGLIALSGCNSSQPAPAPSSTSAKSATISVDPATAGSISGIVSFKGAPPKMKPLDMSQDPGCPTGPQSPDAVMVHGGKLANVFVYVKEGLPQNLVFAHLEAPVVLDQKGCRYQPHVLGIMTGQQLKILNSDTANHNIHPMPNNNPSWNESQSPTDKPILKTFSKPEMMMPVQCNQHPWMRAYINVMADPYFAVSAADGSFSIKGLPPGEYTLAAVHEKFGEQTMKVRVGPKMDTDARFTFAVTQQ